MTQPITASTASHPSGPAQGSRDAAVGAPAGRKPAARIDHLIAVAMGVFAFSLSFAASWVPSFWGDEAASVLSAERSWPSLFRMLGHVDAVHGTYYAFLKLWIDAFGASELSVRLPSAIAVGAAAAGVVVLVGMLGTRRVALIAGIAFAVLPRTTYMGAEARSYAIGTACAVWLTVLFVRLVARRVNNRWAWAGYALLLAVAIFVFLYLVLLVVVYAVVLLSYTRDRRVLRRWFVWSALGVALALPVMFFAFEQRGQISFLDHRPGVTPSRFLVAQWFGSDALAAAAWATIGALIVTSVVLWLRGRRSQRTRDGAGQQRMREDRPMGAHPLIALRVTGGAEEPRLFVLALAWFLLPPLILFIANTFIAPLYTIRYMSFVTPAIAILIAIAIDALPARRWVAVIAVAALVALAAPSYIAQRGPYAKDKGSDWAQVAAVMHANARHGDAVVFDESVRPSRRPRLAMHLYPEAFRGLADVRLETAYTATDGLWDRTGTIPEAATKLAATDGRVWLIEYHGPDGTGSVSIVGQTKRLAELRTLGYHLTRTFTLHRDAVYLLTKGS